jgi:integrating conjugative element protein (TIGR03749 family)
MRVAIPSRILERLRVQSADGAIYLRATGAFEPTRVELQDTDTGALVLLDLTAAEAPADDKLDPLRIVLTKHDPAEPQSQRGSADADSEHPASISTPSAVLLTRYAAQSLYAPLRTIEPVAGIIPTPVRATQDLTTLLPALPVRVTILGAWRLQDQWVTSLRITNLTAMWQQLDPRTLQGDFLAATFQHRQLGPQGDSTDTTVLYLVTRGHGLAESLLPAISPVDAATNLSAPRDSEPSHEK